MNNTHLTEKIEAVLFWKGEPVTIKRLAEMLAVSVEEIETALVELDKLLEGRGVRLTRLTDEVLLTTHPRVSDLIDGLTKEEISRDLGKAGLETLTIVAYRGPVSRRDIDYIRGVNSQFILRNLLVRGLVERVVNPKDERGFLYQPTLDLLNHLGIKNRSELPEYDALQAKLAAVVEQEEKEKSTELPNE